MIRRFGGLAVAGVLAALGTFWALQRGGTDFAVFHQAARWVIESQPGKIYFVNPDRFLYAPGFAWFTTPLGAMPRSWALALWCLLKIFVLIASVDRVARACSPAHSGKVAAIAALFIARPLLIDFQYGQVNLMILGACVWALYGDQRRFGSWLVLGWLAVSKLMALPLLAVPWLVGREGRPARLGAVVGVASIVLVPFLALGLGGGFQLLIDWKGAIQSRGFPLESHNQSFPALLHHYFSGSPTWFNMLARFKDYSVGLRLEPRELQLLSAAWGALSAGTLLGWLLSTKRRADQARWAAVAIALLIVPSHLVWKPYFVMSMPVAAVVAADALRMAGRDAVWRWLVLGVAFAAMNLTGFDLIGHAAASRFEASAVFLLSHLAVTALAASGGSERSRKKR